MFRLLVFHRCEQVSVDAGWFALDDWPCVAEVGTNATAIVLLTHRFFRVRSNANVIVMAIVLTGCAASGPATMCVCAPGEKTSVPSLALT